MEATAPRRSTPWLPLAGLAIVLMAAVAAFFLVRGEREANRWVAHSIRAQLAVARYEEQLIRYESAYRLYLIRGEPKALVEVAATRAAIGGMLNTLAEETNDNPAQAARVAEMRALTARKIAVGQNWVEARRAGRLEQAIKADPTNPGQRLTRQIREIAQRMTDAEQALLAERQASAARLSAAIGTGLALAVLAVLAVAVLMVRDADRRSRQMASARDAALTAERRAKEAALAQAEAEAKLRQLQKMEAVGQLTGGIAHDFNNMLAIVIGSLDLAQRRMEDPDRLRRAIASARDGAERAAALTGRLLAFSRQSPLAPVAVDANRLVGEMSDMLGRTLGETIRVETVLADGLWPTFADPGEIENAVLNLAVNARDALAGQPERQLTIETHNIAHNDLGEAERAELKPGDYVLIAVTDTGIGMPPEVRARAFDPFFTTKDVGKGTGLGLSQVFGFAKQSGGHVAIHSETGRGTSVRLYLPRYVGSALAGTLGGTGAETDVPAGRPDELVLVCEDEARVRHFSVDALRELGYSALSATDGEDALRIVAQTPGVVLLFTDIVMPGMDGRELAERALMLRPDLKLLYTTGYARNAVMHDGVLDPAVAFLPKPFTINQLAQKVRGVIDGAEVSRAA